jgi:hypothetical protein
VTRTDTPVSLATNRDPAHYSGDVAATERDLTPEQREAINAVIDACEKQAAAERALSDAIAHRVRTVQQHAAIIERYGWRPAARAIGLMSETTLRSDASKNIQREG